MELLLIKGKFFCTEKYATGNFMRVNLTAKFKRHTYFHPLYNSTEVENIERIIINHVMF